MPAIICLTGPDCAEKEALLEGLALELEKSGQRVATVRQAQNQSIATEAAMELGQGYMSLRTRMAEPLNLGQLVERHFAHMDMVLTSAHPEDKRLKIEYRPRGASPFITGDPGLRVVVSDGGIEEDLPCFAPGDLSGLAAFVLTEVVPKKEPARVRILLDGKKVPIKEFVQDIVAGTVRAMVASLRGGDRPGRLELYIDD